MQAQTIAILVEPRAQPRPVPDERLVRDLGRAVADGDEAGVGHRVEQLGDALVAPERGELGQRRPAAGVLGPFSRFGQREERAPRKLLLVGIERAVHVFCGRRHRGAHSARGPVRVERELPAVPILPRRAKCVGEQRQGAGLAQDLLDQHLDQARLDVQTRDLRRTGNGLAQLLLTHRAKQQLIRCDRPRQSWMLGAAPVVIGAQCDGDGSLAIHERVEEPLARLRRRRTA